MPVEGICTIMGRGTVVPGRSEKGRMIAGIPVGIIGMEVEQLTASVIGVEMFRKN